MDGDRSADIYRHPTSTAWFWHTLGYTIAGVIVAAIVDTQAFAGVAGIAVGGAAANLMACFIWSAPSGAHGNPGSVHGVPDYMSTPWDSTVEAADLFVTLGFILMLVALGSGFASRRRLLRGADS